MKWWPLVQPSRRFDTAEYERGSSLLYHLSAGLFEDYIQDIPAIKQIFVAGEAKARSMAKRILGNVRTKLGYAQVPTGK